MDNILIDGDIFAYRAAFSCENDELDDALEKVDDILTEALSEVLWDYDQDSNEQFQLFLTGKGNFRYDIAVTAPYKGNREGVEKPRYLADVRKHMVDNWGAVVSSGEEADDLIGIAACSFDYDCTVISVDKDMMQLPCSHFNPVKHTWTTVSEFDGMKFFYSQILTGDSADNIIGLFRVGPVKASKILDGITSECDAYLRVLEEYDNDVDRVTENGRLLWLRRSVGDIWEPPVCASDQD
jgi:hypothetical protein